MPEEKSKTGGLSGVVWGRSCEEAETREAEACCAIVSWSRRAS